MLEKKLSYEKFTLSVLKYGEAGIIRKGWRFFPKHLKSGG